LRSLTLVPIFASAFGAYSSRNLTGGKKYWGLA
jgi:hypothetical protein